MNMVESAAMAQNTPVGDGYTLDFWLPGELGKQWGNVFGPPVKGVRGGTEAAQNFTFWRATDGNALQSSEVIPRGIVPTLSKDAATAKITGAAVGLGSIALGNGVFTSIILGLGTVLFLEWDGGRI